MSLIWFNDDIKSIWKKHISHAFVSFHLLVHSLISFVKLYLIEQKKLTTNSFGNYYFPFIFIQQYLQHTVSFQLINFQENSTLWHRMAKVVIVVLWPEAFNVFKTMSNNWMSINLLTKQNRKFFHSKDWFKLLVSHSIVRE